MSVLYIALCFCMCVSSVHMPFAEGKSLLEIVQYLSRWLDKVHCFLPRSSGQSVKSQRGSCNFLAQREMYIHQIDGNPCSKRRSLLMAIELSSPADSRLLAFISFSHCCTLRLLAQEHALTNVFVLLP
jgi:hypothetical protein